MQYKIVRNAPSYIVAIFYPSLSLYPYHSIFLWQIQESLPFNAAQRRPVIPHMFPALLCPLLLSRIGRHLFRLIAASLTRALHLPEKPTEKQPNEAHRSAGGSQHQKNRFPEAIKQKAVYRLPCRPPGARSSSGSLWAGGSLGTLGSGDSLRAYLAPFTGTARRTRLSPGTHGPGLPPFITNAGHPRHFPWFHRTGSAAAGRIVPFRLRSPRMPETIWRGALRPAAFLRRRLARPLIPVPVRAPLPEQIRRIALPVPVIVIQLKTPHSYLIFNHGACDMIHYMHGRSICFSSQALIGPGLCSACRMPLPTPRSSRRPWR